MGRFLQPDPLPRTPADPRVMGMQYFSRLAAVNHPLPGDGFLPTSLGVAPPATQTGFFMNPLGLNVYPYVLNNPLCFTDPLGLLGEEKIKKQLDQYFGEGLTEQEKQTISNFTGQQIKPWHIPGLMSKNPTALKQLEGRVREALKTADKTTQDIFGKLEKLKTDLENRQKEEQTCR